MKISIIIPSFKRAPLLKWNLNSLAKQNMPFEFETIVLNDGIYDETESLCSEYKDRLNIKYFFTGKRNLEGSMVWRCPGYAINIGVKKSVGDIIVLCCAEMFHVNDTMNLISYIYNGIGTDKVIAIPQAKDDNGHFLNQLTHNNGVFTIDHFNSQPPLLNVRFPFLLAMKKKEFMDIGGYDEDFVGTDFDDTDFVERLISNGCEYAETHAKTVHLWHPRLAMSPDRAVRYKFNEDLYTNRKNIIVRNEGKEWGVHESI